MPRESARERLERWRCRVARGLQVRKDWCTRWQVDRLAQYYLGEQVERTDDETDIWLNQFFATLRTMLPKMMAKTPTFHVQPRAGTQPFGDRDARLLGAVLDAIATQDGNLDNDARLALQQAFFAVGVLKVVYDPRFEPNPRAGEPVHFALGGPTGLQIPMLGADGQAVVEPDEILKHEVYAFDWVDWRRMIFPDEGPNRRKWTWIAEEVEVTLDDAKDDPRFPGGMRRQMVANATASKKDEAPRQPREFMSAADKEHARVRYIEAYDRIDHKLYIWADGQPFSDDSFLFEDALPDGIEEDPYSILAFLPITDPEPSPWPLPVVYNWLPMQREYNLMRRRDLEGLKRSARKVLYDANTFVDEEEARKCLASDADLEAAMVNDLTRLPVLFADSVPQPDRARNLIALRDDWRSITGQTGARQGDGDVGTATEAVLVEQAASTRDQDMKQAVDRWLADTGGKMLQRTQQTLTLDLWVQIRGWSDKEFQDFLQSPPLAAFLALQFGLENVPTVLGAVQMMPQLQRMLRERFGALHPVKVTREQLQFQASVEVVPGSVRPLQKAELVQLTAALGPLVQATPSLLEALVRSFDLPFGDRIAEELRMHLSRAVPAEGLLGGGGAVRPQQPGNGLGGRSPLSAVGGRRTVS